MQVKIIELVTELMKFELLNLVCVTSCTKLVQL
eukprot:SAG31_NODE_2354_length_5881_cov_7.980111_3_plen_33_part_00